MKGETRLTIISSNGVYLSWRLYYPPLVVLIYTGNTRCVHNAAFLIFLCIRKSPLGPSCPLQLQTSPPLRSAKHQRIAANLRRWISWRIAGGFQVSSHQSAWHKHNILRDERIISPSSVRFYGCFFSRVFLPVLKSQSGRSLLPELVSHSKRINDFDGSDGSPETRRTGTTPSRARTKPE